MSCGGGGAATIPVVDLSADEAEAIASLKAACETTGFFFLKGHGIEEDLVSSVFAGAKRFFSRSQEQKDAFKAKEGQLGYSDTTAPGGKRIEQLKFGTQLYLTDCCALNDNEKKDQSKTQGNESEAAWLSLDGTQERWRESVHEYFSSMRSVAGRVRHLIATSLDLEEDYFDKFFHSHVELMDINKYSQVLTSDQPGLDLNSSLDLDSGMHPQGAAGKHAHTDYGMLTILCDRNPGLQVCKNCKSCEDCRSKSGDGREWLDVVPEEGHLICNIGDMLERWTNGRYVSNFHRITTHSSVDKYSVSFFTDPNIVSKLFDAMF